MAQTSRAATTAPLDFWEATNSILPTLYNMHPEHRKFLVWMLDKHPNTYVGEWPRMWQEWHSRQGRPRPTHLRLAATNGKRVASPRSPSRTAGGSP